MSYAAITKDAVVGDIQRLGTGDIHINLKHVKTNDRSTPVIEKGIKLKKRDSKPFLNEIVKEGPRIPLHHVNTVEKNLLDMPGLPLKKEFHLKHTDTKKLWDEIKRGKRLRHVETNDKSKPRVDLIKKKGDVNALLKDIKKQHKLKRTQTNDKSKPSLYFDKNVHIHKWELGKVLDEVTKPHKLKHVNTNDHSKPAIGKDISIKKWDKEGLFKEVKKQHKLKHVETIDKTVPRIR